MPTDRKTEAWKTMRAKEIMQTSVITASANTPLSEVVRKLSDNRISGLPITDEAGHVVGVVSIRDIIERYAENQEGRPRRTSDFFLVTDDTGEEYEDVEVPDEAEEVAGDVMTAEVFGVPATAMLPEVARELVKHNIHRLLVQDNGKYVGLIGSLDLLKAIVKI